MKKLLLITALVFNFAFVASTQDDLMNLLETDEETTVYTYATFKTSKVINSHSVEQPAEGVLLFLIQHRFGRLNTGLYELFGLDQATIRLGLEYGITPRLSIGVGRSSYQKTYDGFVKYKALMQSAGVKIMPVTLSYYAGATLNSLKWEDMGVEERENYFSSRLIYTHKLLIARKFSSAVSFQLMPTYMHKNLVPTTSDANDIFAMGIGGRVKLTKRMSVNAEYYYTPSSQISYEFQQPLSFGFDIETGGHVFQLHFSNAQAFFDSGYLTESTGKWSNGDIYFGFNISRVFTIKKPNTFKE
ncbi:MAG: DUF5777 family beta-barrel protein [Bacteroidales bacterium]|nr:DUF5777 family beta-barrel protein [Bacteroidales bacterium]MCF8403146.1 DUF5777 family beta-barrel protein [Bacteroidales bacterium]